MALMYFARTVKYKGVKYPPHTNFEVADEDVNSLRASGGWLVGGNEAPAQVPQTGTNDTETETDAESGKNAELERLRKQAEELGVVVKKSWGIKKLTEVINDLTD